MNSIKDIILEHNQILRTRSKLEEMFKAIANCRVTVGGSYMLKYWSDAYASRVVNDYDFILYAKNSDYFKIVKFLNHLRNILSITSKGSYNSFYLGTLNGKNINILPKKVDALPLSNFEELQDIIKVKEKWVEKATKTGCKPRPKDLEDIDIFHNKITLPF